jgi:hypothetical protein
MRAVGHPRFRLNLDTGVLTLLATTVIVVTVAPASAHGPGPHGRVFFGPLLAPLLLPFAVAATVTAGVTTVVSGVASAVTAPFTYPYPGYPPAPVYASAPAYAPASAYAAAVYATPRPPTASYAYYCPAARGYYPYVHGCPGGWLTVVRR